MDVGSRLTLQVEGDRQRLGFADDAVYEGATLQTLFDQEAINWTASARWALTPLTRLVMAVQRQQDRFRFSPSRDAESTRMMPGVEFAPSALIGGSASVGVRRFAIADPDVPEFTGVVAAVDLAYTFRGATQFSVQADRDVAYSFSQSAPYYVQTSVTAGITHRLTRMWDLTVSASRQNLAYQTRTLVRRFDAQGRPIPPDAVPEGRAYAYGAGAGLRLGQRSRIGFDAVYTARPAGLSGTYENLRYFTTVTYGF
jgi:hypothetical protein